MGKFDWKAVVGAVAPTVATALGGPLAGVAVKALSSKLLGKDDANEDEVAQAVATADPQTLVKLKELDVDFKKSMTDAGIKLEQIAADDRNSARAREIAVRDSTPRQLAWLLIGGFLLMAASAMVAMFVWPERGKIILTGEAGLFFGTIFGYLANEAKQAAAYYFGSSMGSKEKDDTLSTIAKME